MKSGTPGFSGPRLREAREARVISASALAEVLGVTRAAISQYEKDQASPRPDVMLRMSQALNQPVGFFLRPARPSEQRRVFFRSRAAATKGARLKGEHRLNWLSDIVRLIARSVDLPEVKLNPFDPPSDPRRLTQDDVEALATATRRYWGLGDGPISNVVWLLENNGVVVTRGEFEESTMDSFSCWDAQDPAPLVFLNADRSSAVRGRFNAAHELGHLLLHRSVPAEYWGTDIKERETQASKFGAAFLLPAKTFSDDVVVPSLEAFRALKSKWLVAISAMLMRTEDLGLVSEAHGQRLWRNLSRRRWRTWEPLDDELVPETPRILRSSFDALRSHDSELPANLISELQLAESDFLQLAMLPVSFLESEEPPNLIKFHRDI